MLSRVRSFLRNSFIFLLIFDSALAQNWLEDSPGGALGDDETKLEQIVVTGTRTPKIIEDSPVPVEVITAQELDMVSGGTLAEAIDYIPGLYIDRNEKYGFNVMMQGFDGDRVLVLVNGMPVISPTGESADLDQISALDVERIEVVKGAASVLYGSSAMGGVINIITREQRRNTLSLRLEQGSFAYDNILNNENNQQGSLSGSANYKQASAQFTAQKIENPGFDYDPSTFAQDAGSVDKEFFQANLGWDFGGASINYAPQKFDENKLKINGALPNGRTLLTYQSKVSQQQHDLALTTDTLRVQARSNEHTETSGENEGPRAVTIDNTDIDGQYTWDLGGLEWVAGGRYYEQGMNQAKLDGTIEVDNQSRDGREIFVQGDWQATSNFELLGGGRLQRDSDFGNNSALRVNTMWQQPLSSSTDFKWRTSAGEGYRVPNLKERFYFFDHSNLGYIVLGNEELVAETSVSINTSAELVKRSSTGLDWNLELSLHLSESENLITLDYNEDETIARDILVYTYANRGLVRISGGDLSLGVSGGQHRFNFSYAYLDARDELTDERLPARPYHQLKVNYWWDLPAINSNLLIYALYEEDEYTTQEIFENEYLSVNLALKVDLHKRFNFKVGVDNIFDEHREANLNPTVFDLRPVTSRYVYSVMQLFFD